MAQLSPTTTLPADAHAPPTPATATEGGEAPAAATVRSSEGRRLYVGMLPFDTTDGELNDIFAAFGQLEYAKIMTEKDTGRSRGFGFVTYDDAESALAAKNFWDGQDYKGRKMKVRGSLRSSLPALVPACLPPRSTDFPRTHHNR